MKVIHSVPSLVPESGGTARSVTGLCTALATRGVEVELLSLDLGQQFGDPILPVGEQVHTSFVKNPVAVGQRQLWSPYFGGTLRRLIRTKQIEIVHDHCIWLFTNLAATREAKRAHLPIVVSTRGMLEPWSLNHNRLRKKIMWRIYQGRTLTQAALLHATSESEADQLRRLKLRQPIAIIPNAVEVPPLAYTSTKKESATARKALFLSRVHPKKGLLNLIQALSEINTDGWEVVIAGPDENGHLAEVQRAVAAAHLEEKVKFVGSVDDRDKWTHYLSADLFVLPSFSENFGIVIAEALACGVPVITTTGTPWRQLEETKSGWWVEPDSKALAAAIQAAMSLTDGERKEMGCNGKQLVQQQYSWELVATKMIAVYLWLLGQGDLPECVLLD